MNDFQDIYTSEADFRKRYVYSPSDLLGEGGFAQVFKAFDKQFEQCVALKFYNKGEKGKYDVLHEMKDAREFSHKNIIRVHDAFVVKFEHTGTYNFVQVGVLEFANGGNLRDFIETKPSEQRFIEVLKGILEGIEYLHTEKNILHRDLSPENILMFIEGDKWVPKIADFGISKKIDYSSISKDQKKSTQLLGKIDYMAPEQFYPDKFGIGGTITTQVDLWAFGIILFELFMKRTPFSVGPEGNPMMAIQNITNNPLEDISEIPEPYQTVIKKCLVKQAAGRVQSAGDLIALLKRKEQQGSVQPAATAPIEAGLKRNPVTLKWLWVALGIAALVIAGFFTVRVINKTSPAGDKNLRMISQMISENSYQIALETLKDLPEETLLKPGYDQIRQKLEVWSLIQDREYAKALGMFKAYPSDDTDMNQFYQDCQTLFADSLSILISNRKLTDARNYFRTLNPPHNSTSIISGLYAQLRDLIIIDSLSKDGNAKFGSRNYDAAKASFSRILEYDSDNDVARSMISQIDGIVPVPRRSESEPVSLECIREYSGTALKIRQKPPESSLISLISICLTDSKMKIKLEVKPSGYPVHIYAPGSVHAFFIEYENKTRQLPLKEVKGISTNSEITLAQSARFELIFDKLPYGVKTFNLLEGKSQLDETQTYWNFMGVELSN